MKKTQPKTGITVVGLGPGDPGQLTVEALGVIESAGEIWVRTAVHPVVDSLRARVIVHSFDALYEGARNLEEVYGSIAAEVLNLAWGRGQVVYGVPGHPLVAEETVRRLLELARKQKVEVRIVSGVSFLEPVFTALGLDPVADGLQVVDAAALLPYAGYFDSLAADSGDGPLQECSGTSAALAWSKQPVDPTTPALVCQLDNRELASVVKLVLSEFYPAEHKVTIVSYAGVVGKEKKSRIRLFELDRRRFDPLSVLYLPPLDAEEDQSTFDGIRHVVARLRAPDGCPWDREQTHQTLKPYLLEETHEVLEALDVKDQEKLCEELGDLLLQIVLHAQLATESGDFLMEDVFRGIVSKLIRRHPHVFGSRVVSGAAEVVRNWEQIKQGEKGESFSSLDNMPRSLPALSYAQSLQRRAARVGFDWPEIEGVVDKVIEEMHELKDASSAEGRVEEVGDILFTLVNLARWLNVDAEDALRLTNAKFKRRFQNMERLCAERGLVLKDLSLEQQEELWIESKKAHRGA